MRHEPTQTRIAKSAIKIYRFKEEFYHLLHFTASATSNSGHASLALSGNKCTMPQTSQIIVLEIKDSPFTIVYIPPGLIP